MATCTEEQVIKYNLTLTEEEASYIKELVQNTHYNDLQDEPEHIRKIRTSIWNALNSPFTSPFSSGPVDRVVKYKV